MLWAVEGCGGSSQAVCSQEMHSISGEAAGWSAFEGCLTVAKRVHLVGEVPGRLISGFAAPPDRSLPLHAAAVRRPGGGGGGGGLHLPPRCALPSNHRPTTAALPPPPPPPVSVSRWNEHKSDPQS